LIHSTKPTPLCGGGRAAEPNNEKRKRYFAEDGEGGRGRRRLGETGDLAVVGEDVLEVTRTGGETCGGHGVERRRGRRTGHGRDTSDHGNDEAGTNGRANGVDGNAEA
jgi:hypothetical protein